MSFNNLVRKAAESRDAHSVLPLLKAAHKNPAHEPRDAEGRIIEQGGVARVILDDGSSAEGPVTSVTDTTVTVSVGGKKVSGPTASALVVAGSDGGPALTPHDATIAAANEKGPAWAVDRLKQKTAADELGDEEWQALLEFLGAAQPAGVELEPDLVETDVVVALPAAPAY